MAHKWAKWLRHPCRLGDPHRFRAEAEIRSGPQVGKVAMSPLPSRGSRPLQSGGQNQKWPTCGQSGYVTLAVSGIPTATGRGGKSEVAHFWAKWLRHPCRLGDPHRFRAEGGNQKWPSSGQSGYVTPAVSGIPTASEPRGEIRSGPQVGKVATSPLPPRGSPPLQSRGGNQKWPSSGQSGYVTRAVSWIPTASERGAKSEVAHLWAKWLRHPCRLGAPHCFRAGGKIRSGPQVGKVATSPLPSRGSPPLQGEGGNQKWPTCGQSGYATPAVSGIPTASERGGKSEVAHLWAKWLHHACRLGDPHRYRARGEIRSGPQVGKVATSPLPFRGSRPLQSGGQNQKWPTCGQSGYVTPTVSGIPTATGRGGKSEVALKWAKWLCHHCRLGDPHRFRAGGGIRSGPQGGKVATSPLPSRGSPPLQSRGQNQKWPTSGQSGYVTPVVSGIPAASERRGKSEVAHLWAKWLRHPCRLGDPNRFREGGGNQNWPTSWQSGYVTPAVSGIPTASERGGKSEVAHKLAKWLRHPCRLGDPHRLRAGGKIRSGPQVGKVATSPLPSRGSPPLRSGGQNQKWPTCGQSGYVTPAVSGIPTASERGGKSEVAHLWAKWLCHPCRLGDPHRFGAEGKIRSAPLVGKMATSPLPSRGSPPLQSGGQNQKWPTCGQSGYVTPAVSGLPTATGRGGKTEVALKWAKWLRHPCRLGDPHRFRAGEGNQKWRTSGQSGYVTPAVSGTPTASERGAKSEVAHKWAKWLRHPCRLGDPRRFRAEGEIRSGPLVGKVATSPLPSRGSPPLQGEGGNQKWPTCGQSGYATPAVSGIPTASKRGGGLEVAHKWAKWLRLPCRLGDPHRFRAEGGNQKWPSSGQSGYVTPAVSGIPTDLERGRGIRSGPRVGKVATSPLPSRGSPPLQGEGGNQKWPTSGQSGYVNPAVSGIPTATGRGGKSEVAHLWAKWLCNPCRLGDPHRYGARGEIRSGPLVGKVATSTLPSRGSPPPLRSGGQNQKWRTCRQSGYVTPAVSGIPTASERGGKSEVAHKLAKWLRHPCRLGDPHRLRAGGKIRSGPQVGKVATSPLPSRGSPPLRSGGQNQKWPTCGQSGYVTPAVSGIPTASERGGKSEVAHLWAKWLCHPCRLGDPHRFGAEGKIRSAPLVGKMAMSPLPSRGSPPLQSGGQNQKWPTCGQSGYVTPAVSGIPTATGRGGKTEVALKWAKWLRHPCRLGDPHRFRRGRGIRSGPQVGKVATSPLPSRGPPPLQSGGQNQKWPTSGQSGYVTPAVSGIPTASERGRGIRSGPQVGKVATSPLPSRGPPPLQSGGQNQKWPTSGQSGYVTPAVSGIPTATGRGGKSEVAHLWAKWLCHPCRLGDPHRFKEGGGGLEVAHKWAKWLRHPCRLGDPHRFRAEGGNQKWPSSGQSGYVTPAVSGIPTASERGRGIRSGPQVGKVATSPLPPRGSPPLQSRGGNQKWPTSGQSGYVTPAVSGIPTASERGAKSEVAHLWAKWLRHPCRLGDPHRYRARGEIRSGPLLGKVATSTLPSRGSPPLQRVGGNQKWPTSGKVAMSPLPSRGSQPLRSRGKNQKCSTCGQSGYVTPAASGIPTASERGAKLEVAHKWQSGYVTPAVSGIPTASEQGEKSEVFHLWAKLLRHPCRLGDPHRFRAGGKIRFVPKVGKVATSRPPSRGSPPLLSGVKIRSRPQVGKVAMSPLPSRGSPPLERGGGNQKWPTCGQSGYVTPAVSGIPTASEQRAKSEVLHLWAKWLRHPCRLGDPHRFRAGGKIRSGPQVGKVATSPLRSRGSPPLQSGGQNQKWPTCGQSGYITPAVSGIPTASERRGKSEVATWWGKWLRHPYRLGHPHRFRAGGG